MKSNDRLSIVNVHVPTREAAMAFQPIVHIRATCWLLRLTKSLLVPFEIPHGALVLAAEINLPLNLRRVRPDQP
jgi:hypothetical protein